jgi:hypothetical protein
MKMIQASAYSDWQWDRSGFDSHSEFIRATASKERQWDTHFAPYQWVGEGVVTHRDVELIAISI